MIWALLALLGVPLWLVVLVLAAVLHQRKVVLKRDDIFWYREWTGNGWARRKGVARWVSDVLVRHQGIALVRTHVDPATAVEFNAIPGDPPKGLGADAVEIHVILTGQETPLRLAVSADSRDRSSGPARLRDASPERTGEQPAHRQVVRAETGNSVAEAGRADGGRDER